MFREEVLPGGVLTRVARSHLRVGTFQYFAARGDLESTRVLADYAIERHYPELAGSEAPYLGLLRAVASRQAALVARWLGVGFIHGVMNTDNVSIAGETLDFGPCAFLDSYHPETVFSSIDQMGRYAFGNQPQIAQWNLARFAECLLPLIDDDQEAAVRVATEALEASAEEMETRWQETVRAKLGLHAHEDGDKALAQDLLAVMRDQQADYTLSFRALADAIACAQPEHEPVLAESFGEAAAITPWLARWRERLSREGVSGDVAAERMRAVNPRYIPRNHRIEQVIEAAIQRQDFAPFHRMVDTLAEPFGYRADAEFFATPPAPEERVSRTFCGT